MLSRGQSAVAPFALLVIHECLVQVPAPEVGPQGVGDPDLGIGDLPEQEVGDAQLATGADQQVRIGLAGGVQVLGEGRRVELVRL